MNPYKQAAITSFTGPYSYLGNFFLCKVAYEGLIYPSSEHAFQAAKTLDKIERRRIQDCGTPGAAKIVGRSVELRPGWDEMRVGIMAEILRAKFQQNTVLRYALLDTGNAHLEEGNFHGDTFWGTVDGKGKNTLGRLLMDLRKQLAKGEKL